MAQKLKTSNNPLAIGTSDHHFHPFRGFAPQKYSRFEIALEVMQLINQHAAQLGVPVLFCGDLFHDPKQAANTVIGKTIKSFSTHKAPTYAISGNHDMEEKNSLGHQSPSYIAALSSACLNFYNMDNQALTLGSDLYIAGVPYFNAEEDLIKAIGLQNQKAGLIKDATRILMLHTDLPGAVNPQGYRIDSMKDFPKNMDKLWPNFDWVISGHIHKPGWLSKKCVMLGSPIHQNEGDAGCDMGYWLIYPDRMEFVSLAHKFPQFVKLKKGELPHNEKDYFIPYEEVIEETLAEDSIGTFRADATPKKLVGQYFKALGIKGSRKKALLTDILNEARN